MPWVLFRMSGTEPLLRVYSEAASPELVSDILSTAEAFVRGPAPKDDRRERGRHVITIGLPSLAFRFRRYDNQAGNNGFSSRYRPGPCRLA